MSSFWIPRSMAWLLVFLPAFGYYLSTRLYSWGLFRSSTVGDPFVVSLSNPRHCSSLRHIFPSLPRCPKDDGVDDNDVLLSPSAATATANAMNLQWFRILKDQPQIVSTTWKHDSELGRGYLLLSTSIGQGSVWQWETGGGPIPIGKTLHLQNSGCRSKDYCRHDDDDDDNHNNNQLGSGGLTVDVWKEEGRLIIAEWGEKRIVRLEPETGARTPLIIQQYQPSNNSNNNNNNKYLLQAPRQLLLTAFGDLIILDDAATTSKDENVLSSTLWQLPSVSSIPPLESLAHSRQAHSWTSIDDRKDLQKNHQHNNNNNNNNNDTTTTTTTTTIPQLLLEQVEIGGISLVPQEWLKLYVTMKLTNGKIVLATLTLGEEEDDDEDEDELTTNNENDQMKSSSSDVPQHSTSTRTSQSTLLMDYSKYTNRPGPLVVDEKGILYLATDKGSILIVESPNKVLGEIPIVTTTDSSSNSNDHNENNNTFTKDDCSSSFSTIKSMTLGADHFLYVATTDALYRIKTKRKPLEIPTNLVIPK